QFEQRIGSQGIALDQYFQLTNSNLNEFRQDMYPEAIRNAQTNFMLEKIVADKGFEVTDEEVDQQIAALAEQMGVDIDQARQNLAGVMDKVSFNIQVDKAIQYLVDHAIITEKEAEVVTAIAEEAAEELEDSSN
ncbi:MAG: trigger factor, partial [Firmicutes bacterium]|nr:trigger factor [Bacillota bacterium]